MNKDKKKKVRQANLPRQKINQPRRALNKRNQQKRRQIPRPRL